VLELTRLSQTDQDFIKEIDNSLEKKLKKDPAP
jgi:hypothetical protein